MVVREFNKVSIQALHGLHMLTHLFSESFVHLLLFTGLWSRFVKVTKRFEPGFAWRNVRKFLVSQRLFSLSHVASLGIFPFLEFDPSFHGLQPLFWKGFKGFALDQGSILRRFVVELLRRLAWEPLQQGLEWLIIFEFFIYWVALLLATFCTQKWFSEEILLFKVSHRLRSKIQDILEVQELHQLLSIPFGFDFTILSSDAFFQVPYPVLRKIGSLCQLRSCDPLSLTSATGTAPLDKEPSLLLRSSWYKLW